MVGKILHLLVYMQHKLGIKQYKILDGLHGLSFYLS